MRPLITIIIPSYKRFHKIKKALSSIQTQSFQDWELIVVDNNSKDGNIELVSSLNDDRIKFFEINNNGFISKSINLGIEKSNGKYLAFLDSDDWWTSNKLQIVEKYINKGYKFLYHDMYISKKNNLIKTKTKYCRELFKPIYSDLIENSPASPTFSAVVEKNLFNFTKHFDETKDLITWEDYDAWIKFSKINEEFIKLPGVLGYIKIDNENLLNSDKSIKNIYYFKSRYIQKKTLPIWCLFSLVRSYILKKDFRNAKTNLDILKKNKLNFKNKIRYIFFQVLCYMNVSN